MFQIAGQTKKCSRCKEVKSLSEFHKHKLSRDGFAPACKNCMRTKKQKQRELPKEHIDKKRCSKCQIVKLPEEFNKDLSTRDGFTHQCRACTKLSRQALIKRNPDLPETKKCSQCGLEKPQQQFYKKRENPDGLCSQCKGCWNLNTRMRYIMRTLHIDKGKGLRPGIENWGQAESVVREMAELQVAINEAKTACEKSVEIIKNDCVQRIKPFISKQTLLQFTIEDFIRKTCRSARRIIKKFPFGVVTFYRRKLDIMLNVEFTKERMGMP